jgi:P4 family phage/plasmid primase-like protien
MNGIIPNTSAYIDLNDFLRQHVVSKDDKNTEKTNTRIGKQKDKQIEIYGGSYHISDTEYPIFLQLYYNHVLSKDKKEYLTEKQLTDNGPILMDIDFRHNISVDERQYSNEHIEDFVDKLTEYLNKMYIFDKKSEFHIIILEKPSINRIIDKSITKDGVHIMIWIKKKNLFIQQYLREKMLRELPDMWGDLQITNSWEDVLDDRVSRGEANWQLIGSRKPDHERYKVSHVYKIKYDESDGELFRENVKLTKQFIKDNLENLSARCKKHPSFLPKDAFLQEFQEYEELNTSQKIVRVPSSNIKSLRNTNDRQLLSQIQSQDELDYLVECFLDKNKNSVLDYHYNTIFEYAMILPATYYESGSYDKWIRVGWVLFNISVVDAKEIDKLLIVWLKFSSQSSTFNYSDIPDICDRWHNFDIKQHNNLTKLSLYHWAKIENPEYYNNVRMNNIDYYVEETIRMTAPAAGKGNTKSGCGDFDLARVLYQMFKDEYVCTSIKSSIWFQYKNNRWSEIDLGVTLRKHISTSLRELYAAKGQTSIPVITRDDDDDAAADADSDNDYKERTKRTLQIAILLTQTKNKNNIMIEAKELFYDGEFMAKLDTNPYLLCFNNGVYDFKEKTFRKGKPEDNISMCTNIDYIDINHKTLYNRKSIKIMMDEIRDFMNQLFPVPELCKYMWQHLASTLMGTSTNQTFNMYIGIGQNGKSVLVNFMEKVLGNYKVDVPLSLVTDKRGKIGGVTPEIIGLKGKRYAVLQEPSKDDVLNEGVMKQLTSGKDQIQGRAPYMLATVSFIPQFKLVVTCNNLMKVNSTDHGTWRRIRAVPFLSLFTDKPKPGDFEKPYQFKLNKTIDEKFDEWKEIFAAMLIEECVKTDGIVEDCDLVLEKSRDYQKSQDYISEFIEDRIIKEDAGKVSKLDINNEFNTWYMSNYGGKGPSTKDLHEYMNTKYGKAVRGRWMNISIRKVYSEHTEEHNINEYNDDIDENQL